MLPSDAALLPESTLISAVKQQADSAALVELTNRVTGIYMRSVNKNSYYIPKLEKDEMIESKMTNIYQYALDYKPESNMKFSTFVYEKAKWQCWKLDGKDNYEICENITEGKPDTLSGSDVECFGLEEAEKVPNGNFLYIYKERHCKTKKTPWREIGASLGITHEWARQIYLSGIKQVRKEMKREVC